MLKVKFRVYVTRRCRVCKKIHPMPTHRALYHQGEGDVVDVVAQGHANSVALLEGENKRAEEHDRKSKSRARTNLHQRPLYQYHFEVV